MAKLTLRVNESELKKLIRRLFNNTSKIGEKVNRAIVVLRERGYTVLESKSHYLSIYETLKLEHPSKNYEEICAEFDEIDRLVD